MFKVYNKDSRATSLTPFSSTPIVFEHVYYVENLVINKLDGFLANVSN